MGALSDICKILTNQLTWQEYRVKYCENEKKRKLEYTYQSESVYLEEHRESNSLLIMKVYVFVDEGNVVLVQFTSSFAFLLG